MNIYVLSIFLRTFLSFAPGNSFSSLFSLCRAFSFVFSFSQSNSLLTSCIPLYYCHQSNTPKQKLINFHFLNFFYFPIFYYNYSVSCTFPKSLVYLSVTIFHPLSGIYPCIYIPLSHVCLPPLVPIFIVFLGSHSYAKGVQGYGGGWGILVSLTLDIFHLSRHTECLDTSPQGNTNANPRLRKQLCPYLGLQLQAPL